MIIDAYGYRSTTAGYMNKERKPADFVNSADETKVYLRFTTDDLGPIWEVNNTDGTIRWTVGSWANRESLTYETDVNTPLDVDAGSIEA